MPIIPKIHANGDAIPEEIRALPRWACWREVPSKDGKKPGKPPINATVAFSGKHSFASCNEPTTWASFDVAKQYLDSNLFKPGQPACGLSFCLNGDGIIGIDLDDCRIPFRKGTDGLWASKISEWAVRIIKLFNTYTEISPSGKGIRLFLRGTLPAHGRHKGNIEVYDRDKFLSVTGRKLTTHGAGAGIEDRSTELLAWHQEVFGDATPTKENTGNDTDASLVINNPPVIDEDRLARLIRVKPRAGVIFKGQHGSTSQSEADMALANYAVNAGWDDQEVCDLLVTARLNADAEIKPVAYFERTIAKARADRPTPTTVAAGTAYRKSQGETIAQPEGETTFRESQGEAISPLAELKALFMKHYYFSDDDVIDLVLGVVAGNHLDSDPIWLHLISPPSGGKTELLFSIFDCVETYFLSDFTANSLISGYKDPPDLFTDMADVADVKTGLVSEEDMKKDREKRKEMSEKEDDYSVLPKLNGKVVVTKDFTIIHDKPSEARAQILAILRDCYDGYSSRALGNQKMKGFHSRFNFLTGMTPDIEKSWSLNTLGERFLMYRIQITDRREHARRALKNARGDDKGAKAIRKEIQAAVRKFMDGVERTTPTVSDALLEQILELADILSTCRTYVHRDRNDDMPCLPQAELASRVGKQLMRVGLSVAVVRGKAEVTEAEFKIMKRIALDSLPSNRRLLLSVLWEHHDGPEPLDTFSNKVLRISKNTVRRELENLAELGAVKQEKVQEEVKSEGKMTKTMKFRYHLTPAFIRYCENIGGIPSP